MMVMNLEQHTRVASKRRSAGENHLSSFGSIILDIGDTTDAISVIDSNRSPFGLLTSNLKVRGKS
jgi:hypothetical protein